MSINPISNPEMRGFKRQRSEDSLSQQLLEENAQIQACRDNLEIGSPKRPRSEDSLFQQLLEENAQTQMCHSLGTRFFLLPKELYGKIFSRLPFPNFREARQVCKTWKGVIDELTGIANGELAHPELLNKIQELADECVGRNLIFKETKMGNPAEGEPTYIGYQELIAEASVSYSDALHVYRHLKARKMLLTDPKNYSRLKYDRYVPSYVPLSSAFFEDLFLKKVSAFPEEKHAYCYAVYPPRTHVEELAIFFLTHRANLTVEKMEKNWGSDPMQFQNKAGIGDNKAIIPIAFSRDEIEGLKQEVLNLRVRDDESLGQIKQARFFHEELDRKQAVLKLTGSPPGTYLMRPSSWSEYDAVVSYTTNTGEIAHAAFVIIQYDDKPQLFFEENGLVLESLSQLLDYMSPVWKRPLNVGEEIEKEAVSSCSHTSSQDGYSILKS